MDILKKALIVMALWAAVVVVSLWLFSLWPKTTLGWLLAVFVGPIAFVVFFTVGDLIHEGYRRIPFVQRLHTEVEEDTADQSFSGTRIAFYLLEAVIFIILVSALIFAIHRALGNTFEPIVRFFQENFR